MSNVIIVAATGFHTTYAKAVDIITSVRFLPLNQWLKRLLKTLKETLVEHR
jgi:hypothetical protein